MAVVGFYTGDPSSSDKDNVRFLIGDTFEPFLVSDPEIVALLTTNPCPQLVAAEACEHLAARFAFSVDKRVGAELWIGASKRAKAYRERAMELRRDVVRQGLFSPFVGGLSISEAVTNSTDTDLKQPHTSMGQDDHPSVPPDNVAPFFSGNVSI